MISNPVVSDFASTPVAAYECGEVLRGGAVWRQAADIKMPGVNGLFAAGDAGFVDDDEAAGVSQSGLGGLNGVDGYMAGFEPSVCFVGGAVGKRGEVSASLRAVLSTARRSSLPNRSGKRFSTVTTRSPDGHITFSTRSW